MNGDTCQHTHVDASEYPCAVCRARNRWEEAEAAPDDPEGRKDDSRKLRYSLIPWRALRPVVQVLAAGAAHYGDDNWRRVRPFEARYREALLRHVAAYAEGERVDADSGLPTLAHVVCNALFLLAGPGEDEAGK